MADFGGGAISSDCGALLLGATDKAIGSVDRFAACFADGRSAARVEHSVRTMVGQRVFGIALGYEDLVDHDELRRDPVLGAVLGRLEAGRANCAPLAGKSTLNRLEHAPCPNRRHVVLTTGTAPITYWSEKIFRKAVFKLGLSVRRIRIAMASACPYAGQFALARARLTAAAA